MYLSKMPSRLKKTCAFVLTLFFLLSMFSSVTFANGNFGSYGLQVRTTNTLAHNVSYTLNQPINFNFLVKKTSGSVNTLFVNYHVYDVYKTEVASGSFTKTLTTNVEVSQALSFTPQKYGWYSVKFELYNNSASPANFINGYRTNFGVTPQITGLHTLTSSDPSGGLYELEFTDFSGLKLMRINNKLSFAEIQTFLDKAQQKGMTILMQFEQDTDCTQAKVQSLLNQFKGKIKYYEVINEPNFFMSIADYKTLLQNVYGWIKAIDPAAQVMGPAVCGIDVGWVRGLYEAGGKPYFDILSLHDYEGNESVDPAHWIWKIDQMRSLMNEKGDGSKKIWITERGMLGMRMGVSQEPAQAVRETLRRDVLDRMGIPGNNNCYYYPYNHGYLDYPAYLWSDTGPHAAALALRTRYDQLRDTLPTGTIDFGATGNKLFFGQKYSVSSTNVVLLRNLGTDGAMPLTLNVTSGSALTVVDSFENQTSVPVSGGKATLNLTTLPVYVRLASGQDISVTPMDFGANAAIGATFTYSGSYSGSFSLLNNGIYESLHPSNPNTSLWRSELSGTPQYLEMTFTGSKTVNKLLLHGMRADNPYGKVLDFDVEYWNGSAWALLQQVRTTMPACEEVSMFDHTAQGWYLDQNIDYVSFNTVTTNKLRIKFIRATYGYALDAAGAAAQTRWTGGQNPQAVYLREVEAYNSTGDNSVSAPSFSPAAGSYTNAQTVTISSATSGASIRYTTDGSTPTATTGTVYSAPITISSTTTLKAIAYKSGMTDSSVTTGTYTIGSVTAPQPVVELLFESVDNGRVANTGSSSGAYPSAVLGAQGPSSSTNTRSATASSKSVNFGNTASAGSAVDINGQIEPLKGLQTFTITGWLNCTSSTMGQGGNRIVSWINGGGDGVDLVYKSDGSLQLGVDEWPDTSPAISSAGKIPVDANAGSSNWVYFAVSYDSTKSSNHVTFYFGSQANAAAVDTAKTYSRGAVGDNIGPNLTIGHFNTATRSAAPDRMFRGLIDDIRIYNTVLTQEQIAAVQNPGSAPVSAPAFSPAAGSYTSAQTVTISSATSGASIRYTTDGSTPTASTGTAYSAPITISSTTTLKAIAYKSGMTDSSVTTGTYTIAPPTGTGQITREVWNNINGLYVSALTGNANYPNNPSSTGVLTSFEAPTDIGDNYGQRVHGYLHPAVSGSYEFWISGDNNSELWLSTNDNPSNASRIASVPDWTNPREWTKYPEQHSAVISLIAGQRYYIMALMKEESGGDNLAVSWKAPGGSQEVIPGSYLSPYSGAPVNNVSAPGFSPASGTYTSAQTVTISSATSGASIRYTTDGSAPTATTGTVYSTPVTISSTTTLKAIAYKSGMTDSGVTTGTYTIGVTPTPPPSTIYPFAMCSNSNILSNPQYPVKMLDAGARMYRVDVPFPSVRPQAGNDPNTWNWSVPNAIRTLKQQHPDLEILPILGYGASWAVDPAYQGLPDLTSINSPQNGVNIMPAQSSGNLFGHYVYEMVNRYKDIIRYWESWNEPDLPGYAFFRGSGKEFFAYQRACYLAAKAADPNCKVLFPGLSYASIEGYLYTHNLEEPTPYPPATSFFEEYLKECIKDPNAAANNYYFDIMNQHSYSRASDLYDYTAINSKLMQDYLGLVKPVWITEMGGLDAGPGMFSATPAEYCDYMLQSFAWGSLAGVERFFHFQLDNSNGHGLYDGMLGNPKPALTTYRDVLVKEFADVKFYQQLYGTKGVNFLAGNSAFNPTWKAGYNVFEFRNGSGSKRVIMAFTDKAEAVNNVRIPATAGKTAVLIDRSNNRTPITASGGYYTINLGAATNISGWPVDPAYAYLGQPENMIGGPTLVIVEQ